MPTFDIVSKLDKAEVINAVDQAKRELANRFDFKGTNSSFDLQEFVVTIKTESEFQLQQMLDILKPKLVNRGIDVLCMDLSDPEINLSQAVQRVTLKQGIEQSLAKEISKKLKAAKLKVDSQIQGDKLRVQGKKRDDLQAAIAMLKAEDFEMPLQFENFRD